MMNVHVSKLVEELRVDPWRVERGFSPDIMAVHQVVHKRDLSDEEASTVLNGWITRYQPCLFGRIAARLGLVRYCILSEEYLRESDDFIQEKIQSARLNWLQSAALGDSSALVIAAISEKIALAVPDNSVFKLASRLGALYLLKEIDQDRIYLDSVELDLPSKRGRRLRWDVGVNYFSAQADGRWWHDHRIPGGLAFSMNSVGHLVMSGRVAGAMKEFEQAVSVSKGDDWRHPSIQDLETALIYAMRTISGAADAISGKATNLITLQSDESSLLPHCPVRLPSDLIGKNHCYYEGYYHTDHTLPSSYFREEVERPSYISSQTLDLTYLFNDELDNPDYINAGAGRQVRNDETSERSHLEFTQQQLQKRHRAKGRPVLNDTD